jgi:hypothetical protein
MRGLARYLRDEHGANSMAMFTVNQLHWAAESAARCASVKLACHVGGVSTGVVNNTMVSAYAQTQYKGLAPATFTYTLDGTCNQPGNIGKKVIGSATFVFNLGVYYRSITMTSQACFP